MKILSETKTLAPGSATFPLAHPFFTRYGFGNYHRAQSSSFSLSTFFIRNALAWVVLIHCAACSKLDDPSLSPKIVSRTLQKAPQSPSPPVAERQALFGDVHIHTELSTDAYIMGVRAQPEDVYRFAKGQKISHGAGYSIEISQPLDFVAVTDHAEYLGQARLADLDLPTIRDPLSELLKHGRAWEITLAWLETSLAIKEHGFSPNGEEVNQVVNRSAWQETIDAAERHNEPGVFTSFIGYEWSGDNGDLTVHMHRNVIYRNNNVSDRPFSKLDSNRPEDLWQFLHDQKRLGNIAMAIPHNGNLSRGNMYAPRNSEGKPIDSAYAEMRSAYEPLTEILQIKGSSETHPLLSSLDEHADFEILKDSLFIGEATFETIKGGYLRDALRVGLELQHAEGLNPFKYGVIGSSDSHNASSPSDEANYTGKLPMLDGSAGLRTDKALLLPEGMNPVTSWGSGGLAGVWAEENTRESIFDALQRKETYATSGPRIKVRFFAGHNFSEQQFEGENAIVHAYADGVAMGSELKPTSGGESPGFYLMAWKDPNGANLDRAQIVKGWVDDTGVSHEKVFDVAVADQRIANLSTAKFPDVGNTVDPSTPSYTNTIGGPSILAFWKDPEFQSDQSAFYYVRVLEIPTPRWSTFDAVKLGTVPMEPATIQERAITSSIWYRAY